MYLQKKKENTNIICKVNKYSTQLISKINSNTYDIAAM